jgi:hypothetical protein
MAVSATIFVMVYRKGERTNRIREAAWAFAVDIPLPPRGLGANQPQPAARFGAGATSPMVPTFQPTGSAAGFHKAEDADAFAAAFADLNARAWTELLSDDPRAALAIPIESRSKAVAVGSCRADGQPLAQGTRSRLWALSIQRFMPVWREGSGRCSNDPDAQRP